MKSLEFGAVHAIIAVVAVLLIALGITYRRAVEAAGKFTLSGDGIRLPTLSHSDAVEEQHSTFRPQRVGNALSGRPNPAHLRTLGLVTWEANRGDRIDSAHERMSASIELRLAELDAGSTAAAEARARLRRLAEARHALLQRLSQQNAGEG